MLKKLVRLNRRFKRQLNFREMFVSGGETVKASKQFVANFEVVATRYKLRELGEHDEAKAAARRDMENAEVCFAKMAGAIA